MFPSAGPPCFLDEDLWQFNDIFGDEGNIFPDQQEFIDFYGGLGRTNGVILLPGSVEECYEFGRDAFDYADRFQTPVFVLSDLDLGMNLWMTPEFKYPEKPFDRGKVLSKDDLEKLAGQWGRYKDVDGDGIPYRT